MTGKRPWVLRLAPALMALGAVAACDPVAVAPMPHPVTPMPVAAPQPSAESLMLASYYGQLQAELLTQGLMRTDMGGADTPFTDRMLAENFLRVAFYEEYDRALGGVTRREAPIPLTRWAEPVRVALRFGETVPQDIRATDTLRVGSYLARLARLTGHPVQLADSGSNFTIFIADVDARRALGPALKALLPELDAAQIGSMTEMDRNTYCQVVTQSDPATSTYLGAVAVIPSEHPDLLLMSCIHEEIAQALGLPNDSGLARPSIFNDDQEFALLTRQDEMMLSMLYNPALRPGMTEIAARPVVEMLSARLMGGNS
jgi:Protein of unknown function (DUF2927)